MAESLLGFILTRLDQIESPVFLHRELERFPAGDLAALVSGGVLRETSSATEIPRPAHLPAGGDLIVRPTSKGLFGVAEEDDYFAPIPLSDDDVRQYEVSLPKLAARIRRENEISGSGFDNHDGLISLGQKTIDERATVDVYLSLPNEDEAVLLSRCRRLAGAASAASILLLTPRLTSLSPEGWDVVRSARLVLASFAEPAADGNLTLDWEGILRRPRNIADADAAALDAEIRRAIESMIEDVRQGREVSRSIDQVAQRLHLGSRQGLEYQLKKCGLKWEPYRELLRPQRKTA